MQLMPPWLKERKKKRRSKEWFRRVHHIMMLHYGWIPFEEFKKLPMTTISGLLEEIKYDFDEREKNRRRKKK